MNTALFPARSVGCSRWISGKIPNIQAQVSSVILEESLRNISISRTFPNKIVCPTQCVFHVLCVFKIKTHK